MEMKILAHQFSSGVYFRPSYQIKLVLNINKKLKMKNWKKINNEISQRKKKSNYMVKGAKIT
jgi:hypothetical protein